MQATTFKNITHINDLPLELLSAILSHNAEDIETSRQCALVCRLWHFASLPFVCEHACLSHEDEFQRCIDAVQYTPQFATQSIKKVTFSPNRRFVVLHLFGNVLPMYRRRLFELCSLCPPPEDRPGTGLIYHDPPLIKLPPLPSVKSLDWSSAGHQLRVNHAVFQYLSTFPSLTELNVTGRFANMRQLEIFLRLCGPLDSLDVSFVYFDDYGYLPPESNQADFDLTRLKKLTLFLDSGDLSGNWFVDRFLSRSKPKALRRFELSGDASYIALGPLLTMNAHSLEEFVLGPPVWLNLQKADVTMLNLSIDNLPSLRRFTLTIYTTMAGDLSKGFAWSSSVVASLPSCPVLQSITYRLFIDENELEEVPSHPVPIDLLLRNFPSLRIIIFRIETRYAIESDQRQFVSNVYSERIAQGRIQVRFDWAVDG